MLQLYEIINYLYSTALPPNSLKYFLIFFALLSHRLSMQNSTQHFKLKYHVKSNLDKDKLGKRQESKKKEKNLHLV